VGCQSHKPLGDIHGNPGKQEPPNERPLTSTVTLKNSVESTYLENTYPDQEQNRREERVQESALIHEQSSATDPQQSAEYATTIMQ